MTNNKSLEQQIAVLMPTGRDAQLVAAELEKIGLAAFICSDLRHLYECLMVDVGAVLMTEEALHGNALEELLSEFDKQPVWSDIPVILFSSSATTAEKLLETIGSRINATIVERPVRVAMLASAVNGALRARNRQYETRDLLKKLENADKQKDLFLATLSHELRTPLNSMLGWIRLLREDSNGKVDVPHALEVIERNATAQNELISDILFVSRIVTGTFELNVKPLSLQNVIQTTVDIISPSTNAKSIKLETDFDPNADEITGDADRLQQVIWNLLSNATKFTGQNGKIRISTKRDDANVIIKVKDDGKGINNDFLPLIFERFKQEDNTYTRKFGGLGLGLAIVRDLVKMHGGEITAFSEGENKGSIFTVTLPVTVHEKSQNAQTEQPVKEEPEQIVESTNEQSSSQKLEELSVLLVEDDDDSREMLEMVFKQSGFKTKAVASAAEAFEVLQNDLPKMLISDIGLPDESGYDLIRKIRLLPIEKGGAIPAIALTGYASGKDQTESAAAGFQKHIAKPVDPTVLLEMVANLTNGKLHD
ncbi:MAG: response regulator [Pyrinomonadaceae bacterium]|nr:response regulator [Pyrinomonadaceae bacterium]